MQQIVTTKDYAKNVQRVGEYTPCAICGKAIKNPDKGLHIWFGDTAVTPAEAVELYKTDPGGDTGWYPVGPDCIRNNPQLLPYIL